MSEFHELREVLLLLSQLWIKELLHTCLLSWKLLLAAFACWSWSWLCWWAQQCEHCLQWCVSSSETLTSSVWVLVRAYNRAQHSSRKVDLSDLWSVCSSWIKMTCVIFLSLLIAWTLQNVFLLTTWCWWAESSLQW